MWVRCRIHSWCCLQDKSHPTCVSRMGWASGTSRLVVLLPTSHASFLWLVVCLPNGVHWQFCLHPLALPPEMRHLRKGTENNSQIWIVNLSGCARLETRWSICAVLVSVTGTCASYPFRCVVCCFIAFMTENRRKWPCSLLFINQYLLIGHKHVQLNLEKSLMRVKSWYIFLWHHCHIFIFFLILLLSYLSPYYQAGQVIIFVFSTEYFLWL